MQLPVQVLQMVMQIDGCLCAERHRSLQAILCLHLEFKGRALGQGQIVM